MTEDRSSHRQILRSTSLVGGSTVISVLISVFRTKILAVLLGPSGVALFGLYASATGLISNLSRMGIRSSGVRQIAAANGHGDRQKISRTIITLRRVALLTGVFGAGMLLVLRVAVSRLTFGDDSYAGSLALLSLSIFFSSVSAGQTALIQGMRRIRALATIRVVSALLGVVVTVPVIWFFRERGVALSMVAVSAMALLVSWRFAQRIPVDRVALSWRQFSRETRALIGLGFAFMASAVMTAGVTYFIRTCIVRQLGLDPAGYYQAAYNLAGIYVGTILSAMGADFYPRLTAVAHDNEACNRVVNEQSEVGLLIAGPGVVATLVLAPLVIRLFYSIDFSPAVDVLRWQILGVFGRVVSWPLGFTILAKGRGRIFIATELSSNAIHVLFVVLGMQMWGLVGTGVAFFALYVFSSILMRVVVGRVSGFRWTGRYLRLLGVYVVAISAAFATSVVLDQIPALIIGGVITLLVTAYSARALYHLLGAEVVRGYVEKIAARLGFLEHHG